MKPFFFIVKYGGDTMEKHTTALAISFGGALVVALVCAFFFGAINHPGHCGASNPNDLDYDALFSDAGYE